MDGRLVPQRGYRVRPTWNTSWRGPETHIRTEARARLSCASPQTLRGAVAGLSLAVLAACAPATGGLQEQSPPASQGTVVRVANNEWEDLTIYIAKSESVLRLGSVLGMSTRALQVPAAFVAGGTGLRLLAGPRGAPHIYSSVPFDVVPGRTVWWTLEHRRALSSVSIP